MQNGDMQMFVCISSLAIDSCGEQGF